MSDIGKRIKEIRKLAHQTQLEFAEKLGIDRAHVSNIENDKTNPSITLHKLICAEYGVSEEWLLNGTGSMKSMKIPKVDWEYNFVEVDFSLHPELLEYLDTKSNEEFRPLDMQIIYELDRILGPAIRASMGKKTGENEESKTPISAYKKWKGIKYAQPGKGEDE